jgi:hypothetical protein
MIVWRDGSSYRQGERGAVDPTCWRAEVGLIRLSVHRFHGCEGWFASCVPDIFIRRELTAHDADGARAEALDLLRRWLDQHVRELGGA